MRGWLRSREDARTLFESIPVVRKDGTPDLIGLRDRALIGTLFYSFARIGATLAMQVEDFFPNGKKWHLRLHEKGGKYHEMPVHHTLLESPSGNDIAHLKSLSLSNVTFHRSSRQNDFKVNKGKSKEQP
jgi:integrase